MITRMNAMTKEEMLESIQGYRKGINSLLQENENEIMNNERLFSTLKKKQIRFLEEVKPFTDMKYKRSDIHRAHQAAKEIYQEMNELLF